MKQPSDTVAPDLAVDAATQAIRDTLRRRINSEAQPSRLINQIVLADMRCKASKRALEHLIGRSPKVMNVIRAELRRAFERDPDNLLFTERGLAGVPPKVETLTERALGLLVRPSVVVNLNQFTALSIRGDADTRLPYTPLDVLQRVIEMRLSDRLAYATSRYWQTLAQGSWLTRRQRWDEQQAQLFVDRAFLARQLDELSSAGMAMIKAIIDAPSPEERQCAGGDWASVQVGQLLWPGSPAVAVPGALHVYPQGDPGNRPQVIYLPGAGRNFYEFPDLVALQCGVLALRSTRLHDLWQCLPLDRRHALCRPADLSPRLSFTQGQAVLGNALAQSAEALLSGQWANELACAVKINPAHVFAREQPGPADGVTLLAHVEKARQQWAGGARLGAVGDQLLKWDHRRRSAEIVFAGSPSGQALLTLKRQAHRYEKGWVALLAADDLSVPTPAYQACLSLMSQAEGHAQTLKGVITQARQRALDLPYWAERPGGSGTPRRVSLFMNAQVEALRCEVQLQHRLKLLSSAHRDLMVEILDQPLASRRPASETRVLSIAVGSEPDAFYSLLNIWVVTTAAAIRVPMRQRPVMLYAFGADGGVVAFSGLQALTRSIKASLGSRDDSVLWGCVERDKRHDLRAHAARGSLGVRYVEIEGKPALVSLKKLLGAYARLHQSREDITRIFSEVKDPAFSRELLMLELETLLKCPVNSVLGQALANVELLRKAASEAKKLPAWLAGATQPQRKRFRRSQRVYLGSAVAFFSYLQKRLPDLATFARRTLSVRLGQDGLPAQLDIDRPLIDMPDDVSGRFCGWESACAPGDRKQILTPSAERTTFSLLQLTLHNLDPQAPWTKWRFNFARYVQPEWEQRLNADYLIPMVASLDMGGQYAALVNRLFYPPANADPMHGDARIAPLLNRALQTGADHHLFLATQRGLSASAQRIFNTAMAARTPQGLVNSQHQLQLHAVHLVGHTMQHDRYIAGIVVMEDRRSGRCLVYWPQAPHARALTEHSNLQAAQDELNRTGALPDNAKALARQVAPGWAFEAHATPQASRHLLNTLGLLPGVSLIRGIWRGIEFIRSFKIRHLEPTALLNEIETIILEQIASDPRNWLALVATSECNATAMLYRASVLDLQRRTQEASRSGKELENYRLQRLGEQSDARIRRIVGFFSPLFGLFNDAYELLLAARHYHRFGDPRDAVDVGFMSTLLAIDLLSNFIPGPTRAGVATPRGMRSAPMAALARMQRLRMTAPGAERRLAAPSAMPLKSLERFKIQWSPEGAIALKGIDEKGVYVKGGQTFVIDDTHHYPVYRRSHEASFRLKNQQRPGQDELLLNIHHSKEWLLSADAPAPFAGTRSGVLDPWRAPPSPAPDWWPPLMRTATENRILESATTATHWLEWRMQIPVTEQLSSPAPGVFHVPMDRAGFSYHALRVAPPNTSLTDPLSGYYRLLPQGDQAPLNRIVFITKNQPRVSLASADIEYWLLTAPSEQPLPASRTPTGGWQLHAPLFDRPLEASVGQAFARMTEASRRFTVARMVELSGPQRPATATHLLNLRATLDAWLPAPPARPGQTDDLLRMLRPIDRPYSSTTIGYEGASPGFIRVDFTPSGPLDAALQRGGRPLAAQRDSAQRAAVRAVLEGQGFTLGEFKVLRGGEIVHEAVATHPNSPNRVYYLSYLWLERGSFTQGSRFSERWFTLAIKTGTQPDLMRQVASALRENRLTRIMAGIQWPVAGRIAPTVYFVKLMP